LREIGQVLIGQIDEPLAHVLLRKLDEVGTDAVADATRAAVEHDPHAVLFVETDSMKWLPVPSVPM
jgi:hypothetical protein